MDVEMMSRRWLGGQYGVRARSAESRIILSGLA